jgi:hypothetical protein
MLNRSRWFNSKEDLRVYSEAFWAAGIRVHVWGYPQPGLEKAFFEGMAEIASICRAESILLDPEKPYRKQHAKAVELTGLFDAHSVPFGVTSYGSAWNFKDFPYKEFSKGAAYGSPQVYDVGNVFGPSHARRAYDAYAAHGYSPVVMSGPLYNKTAAQFSALLSTFPTESKGVIFWDWANLKLRKNQHLAASLKQLHVG